MLRGCVGVAWAERGVSRAQHEGHLLEALLAGEAGTCYFQGDICTRSARVTCLRALLAGMAVTRWTQGDLCTLGGQLHKHRGMVLHRTGWVLCRTLAGRWAVGGVGKPGGLGSGTISMQRRCTLLEWACDSGSRVVVRIDAQVCCHDYLQPCNEERLALPRGRRMPNNAQHLC